MVLIYTQLIFDSQFIPYNSSCLSCGYFYCFSLFTVNTFNGEEGPVSEGCFVSSHILRNIALVFFNVVGNVSKVARSDALVPLHMFGVVKYIVWLCI